METSDSDLKVNRSIYPHAVNGSVCAYVRSDVQSSRLPQFDLVNPRFQLI